MEPRDLKSAASYVNNLLSSRGLLRGPPIDFARPTKDPETPAHIINLVHELLSRRDKEAEQRETLAETIRGQRTDAQTHLSTISTLQGKLAESERRASLLEAQTRAQTASLRTVESGTKALKDEGARLKMLLAQVRTQFANEVRKRDLMIQRMKERLADARRGGRPGPSTLVITGATPTAGWEEGEEGKLGQETTEFLTELSQELADENDALLALLGRCLSQLKGLQGLPDDGHVVEGADQGSMLVASPAKCEVLAQELELVMAGLEEMLNQPDYVPIQELAERDEVIRLREEEVRALKARCDTLHEEWRKAIDLVDGWNKKLGESVGGGEGLIPPMDEEELVAAVKKGREGRDKKKDGRHTRRKSRKSVIPESIEEEDEEEIEEDVVAVQEQIPAETRKSHKKRSRKSVPDALPEESDDPVVADIRTPQAKPRSRRSIVPQVVEESEDEQPVEDTVQLTRTPAKKRSRRSVAPQVVEESEDEQPVEDTVQLTRTPVKKRSRKSVAPQVVEESEDEQPVEDTVQLTRTPAKKRSRKSVAPEVVEESEDELPFEGTLQLSRTPILTPTPARKRGRRNIAPQIFDEADDEQPVENALQNTRNKKQSRRSEVSQAVEEIDEEPPVRDTIQLTRTPTKKRSRKSVAPQAVEEEEEESIEDTIQVAEDPAEEHHSEPEDEYEEDSITVIPVQEMDRNSRRSERQSLRSEHDLEAPLKLKPQKRKVLDDDFPKLSPTPKKRRKSTRRPSGRPE